MASIIENLRKNEHSVEKKVVKPIQNKCIFLSEF